LSRVGGFTDRHPLVGPVVFISSCLYFVAQAVAAWVWNPPYSIVTNTISDLGNTAEPRHVLMNVAFIGLGVVMAAGSVLIYQEYRESSSAEQRAALIGFILMGVAGVGAMLVGIFPENVNHTAHVAGAAAAIGSGNAAMLVLGWVLVLPGRLRSFMRLWAPAALVALVLFACHRDFGIGAGSMERIAAYPETIWLISFGAFIAHKHMNPPFLMRRLVTLGKTAGARSPSRPSKQVGGESSVGARPVSPRHPGGLP